MPKIRVRCKSRLAGIGANGRTSEGTGMSYRDGTWRASSGVRRVVTALALVALALFASAAVAEAKSSNVWLCKPGKQPDPCKTDRTATVVSYENGVRHESIAAPTRTGKPAVDCFYVYPTVSEQAGPNADLTIEPQETQIAIDQASRFSQDCKVYAPMYRQLTLAAINNPGSVTPQAQATAYLSMLSAFEEYLT